jgi:hypothetical protein
MANNNFPGAAPANYWEFPESDSTQHPVFSSHPILRPGEYYPAFGFTGATSYEQYPIPSSFPSQDNSEFFDPLLLQVDLMSPQVNSGAELSAMVSISSLQRYP